LGQPKKNEVSDIFILTVLFVAQNLPLQD